MAKLKTKRATLDARDVAFINARNVSGWWPDEEDARAERIADLLTRPGLKIDLLIPEDGKVKRERLDKVDVAVVSQQARNLAAFDVQAYGKNIDWSEFDAWWELCDILKLPGLTMEVIYYDVGSEN